MKKIFLLLVLGFGALLLIAWLMSLQHNGKERESSRILAQTWRGYKAHFVGVDGKVVRPSEQDTTSEGQSNAMLRAVVMGDREEFDRILRWTEDNLSRQEKYHDHLLSWHYSNGMIRDAMPATDSDIDYAMSLVLASQQWSNDSYADMARRSLKDILDKLTIVFENRRYLLPWMVPNPSALKSIPQNLSYYSPAYFKMFYAFDHDPRWLELVDTDYVLLSKAQKEFNSQKGEGLVPDWMSVDHRLSSYEDKSTDFSWEGVRIPLRVGLDAFFYKDPRALDVLSKFSDFFERQLKDQGKLVSAYSYDGKPLKDMQPDPLIYAAAYVSFELTNHHALASQMLVKLRTWVHWNLRGSYYKNPHDYYANSLAWVGELLNQEEIDDQR
jgi:endoglucanase